MKKAKALFLVNLVLCAVILSFLAYYKLTYIPYYDLNYEQKEHLAEEGDLFARFKLGYINATHNDFIEAEKWFNCASGSRCVPGEFEYLMGLEFSLYRCNSPGYQKATNYWMLKSAAKGYKEAQKYLKNHEAGASLNTSAD